MSRIVGIFITGISTCFGGFFIGWKLLEIYWGYVSGFLPALEIFLVSIFFTLLILAGSSLWGKGIANAEATSQISRIEKSIQHTLHQIGMAWIMIVLLLLFLAFL